MVFIISICEIRMYQLKEEMLQCTDVKKSKIALSTKNRLFMPITPFSNQRHPTHFVVEGHIYHCMNVCVLMVARGREGREGARGGARGREGARGGARGREGAREREILFIQQNVRRLPKA